MSFKKQAPSPEAEEAFFAENGYRDFDFAFVSPWPKRQEHAQVEKEQLMLVCSFFFRVVLVFYTHSSKSYSNTLT